jgi:hypothetical protein
VQHPSFDCFHPPVPVRENTMQPFSRTSRCRHRPSQIAYRRLSVASTNTVGTLACSASARSVLQTSRISSVNGPGSEALLLYSNDKTRESGAPTSECSRTPIVRPEGRARLSLAGMSAAHAAAKAIVAAVRPFILGSRRTLG